MTNRCRISIAVIVCQVALAGCGPPPCDVVDAYYDGDRDGWGVGEVQVIDCPAPAGYATTAGDCDDRAAVTHPGAMDHATDAVDQNCDGVSGVDADGDGVASFDSGGEDCDDADAALVALDTFYLDSDADGYGTSESMEACGTPAGYAIADGDCDDADPLVNPAATEICGDAIDSNCDESNLGCGPAGELVSPTTTIEMARDQRPSPLAWGDFNGDGVADLAVGDVPVRVLTAPLTADSLANPSATLEEDHASSYFGNALASAGDRDGDGADDLVVGDPLAGRAYVFHGPVESGGPADAMLTIEGTYNTLFGATLAGGMDMTGDGVPDLLVGSHSSFDAAVFLVSGTSTGLVAASDAVSILTGVGAALDLCDLDGDGLGDALIGAPESSGTYIELSPLPATWNSSDTADRTIYGGSALYDFGAAVSCAGDFNGDGLRDVLVGSPSYGMLHWDDVTPRGAAWVLLSPVAPQTSVEDAAVARFYGEGEDDMLGGNVDSADLDGDGNDDLVLGSMRWGANRGAIYVVPGPVAGVVELPVDGLRLIGASTEILRFGTVFAVKRNGIGDGRPEIAMADAAALDVVGFGAF